MHELGTLNLYKSNVTQVNAGWLESISASFIAEAGVTVALSATYIMRATLGAVASLIIDTSAAVPLRAQLDGLSSLIAFEKIFSYLSIILDSESSFISSPHYLYKDGIPVLITTWDSGQTISTSSWNSVFPIGSEITTVVTR